VVEGSSGGGESGGGGGGGGCGGGSSNGGGGGGGDPSAAAARAVKAATGAVCESMLRISCDAAALRGAARQGMTTLRVPLRPAPGAAPAAGGGEVPGGGEAADGGGGGGGDGPLTAAALERGLAAHAAKLEDSRGY
jgi:loricrin